MEQFLLPVELRWADLDPNGHVRHSAYYDYGANCRVAWLSEGGITVPFMQQKAFGPVIFREECVFKKELRMGDVLSIDLRLLAARRDYSRWTIQHSIFKAGEILAAVLTLEGAWLDTAQRRLCVPPEEVLHCFDQAPRAEGFCWTDKI
jgi:acyl-CoA thioester hydrolase